MCIVDLGLIPAEKEFFNAGDISRLRGGPVVSVIGGLPIDITSQGFNTLLMINHDSKSSVRCYHYP